MGETPLPGWFAALDPDDQAQCVNELRSCVTTLGAGAHPAQLEDALAEWKRTGEALSDPVAREVLTAEGFDESDFTEAGPPGPDHVCGPDTCGADFERDEFDHWLDNSEHNLLVMSIGDEGWRQIADEAAFAAWKQARESQRQRIRERLMERVSTLAFVATSRHVEAVLVKDIEYVLAGDDDD